jgi:hypothetical protein
LRRDVFCKPVLRAGRANPPCIRMVKRPTGKPCPLAINATEPLRTRSSNAAVPALARQVPRSRASGSPPFAGGTGPTARTMLYPASVTPGGWAGGAKHLALAYREGTTRGHHQHEPAPTMFPNMRRSCLTRRTLLAYRTGARWAVPGHVPRHGEASTGARPLRHGHFA